ncbi:MAG: 3-phosphoshikimate 1-carboxyvinyltransferase [Pyrinomonadaceae bacterium]|nr:3-phosphoshikimate 1-carboxyvinyltransferase [Acidobacteriota bacterium]MBK7932063.1 3-phosphoshikimate 1-carboxyvinyltransferase [Acidobacteriota bacterium]MBP7375784.1 3-phosphoshikimate 1-carboxyvinyltransferase [Pyrinomonadaceae bacterium]
MKLTSANSIRGRVVLPGDKSMSHRAAMIASIAEGTTRIENFSRAVDCQTTLDAIRSLGVEAVRNGTTVMIAGNGKRGLRAASSPIDCGNSGTTIRLISGILAGQSFESVLTGDESLAKRPMKRIIDPLRAGGAKIKAENNHIPLHIFGGQTLYGREHKMEVASAQVKSCILLAGLYSDGTTTVIEPVATRDHTERMLRWFGVEVVEEEVCGGRSISLDGSAQLTSIDLNIPADISSAAFFLAAASCLPNSQIAMPNVGINPTRNAVLEVLLQFGSDISIENERIVCNEPVADLIVRSRQITGAATAPNILRGNIIANLIDEIPILAVLGTQLEGGLEIRDAAELRVKESDRIASIVENLRRMGAGVIEFPDGLRVSQSQLHGALIDSFGDHRIAMAFAVAALFAEGETEINGHECVDISFPGFFETLAGVVV